MAIPLDYATPSKQHTSVAVLPFVALDLFLLEFPVAYMCFVVEAGNMGDDRGMTQATRDEMSRIGTLALAPVFLGLLVAVTSIIRFRRYDRVGKVFAIISITLCVAPFIYIGFNALCH